MDKQLNEDHHWMELALRLAEKAAELGEVPVGAVVVQEGRVIGEGWNQPISTLDSTAHAEIMALRDAEQKEGNYRLPEATLYVTLEPCMMCAGALVHARIARLVFAATEPKAGVVCSQGHLLDSSWLNHKIEYCSGVLEQRSATLLSDFFRQRRLAKKRLKRSADPLSE